MKIKCDYCGNLIEDTQDKCPKCGSANKHLKRTANGVPTTIEELKAFAKAHNLPLEKMRFFIDQDYKQPKAFGIYKDERTGDFVVYKNKADGTRAIRYSGKDETYAVNELYQKMKEEANIQLENNPKVQSSNSSNKPHSNNKSQNNSKPQKNNSGSGVEQYRNKAGNVNRKKNQIWPSIKRGFKKLTDIIGDIIAFAFVFGPVTLAAGFIVVVFVVAIFSEVRNYKYDGYYDYNGETYVSHQGSWYEYDNGDWVISDIDDEPQFMDNYKEFFVSKDYADDYDCSDFEKSDKYKEAHSSSSSSSGSSYSWDDDDDDWSWSSSWDNDWGSNWDSDWNSGWNSDWNDWDSGYSDWDDDW